MDRRPVGLVQERYLHLVQAADRTKWSQLVKLVTDTNGQ